MIDLFTLLNHVVNNRTLLHGKVQQAPLFAAFEEVLILFMSEVDSGLGEEMLCQRLIFLL
jgi:hypothetical protein